MVAGRENFLQQRSSGNGRCRRFPRRSPEGADESGIREGNSLTGTVTLRNANWKADFLASHVLISQATLHLDNTALRWDPVVFFYGPVKGTASLNLPASCDVAASCLPIFRYTSAIWTRASCKRHFWARTKRHHALNADRTPAPFDRAGLAAS